MNDKVNKSIAQKYPDKYKEINLFIWLPFLLLVFGLFSPIMTIKKWIFIQNTLSIYSGLIKLVQDGQYFLFIIIFFFSVVFPVGKFILMFCIWHLKWELKILDRLLTVLGITSKYSMLDVFVVAVLVVMIRIGIVSEIEIHYGIYVFSAAILLSILCSHRLGQIFHTELRMHRENQYKQELIDELEHKIVLLTDNYKHPQKSGSLENNQDEDKSNFRRGYFSAINDTREFLSELKGKLIAGKK